MQSLPKPQALKRRTAINPSGHCLGQAHGDAAFTVGVGEISPEAARLISVTEASLAAGIAARDGLSVQSVPYAQVRELLKTANLPVEWTASKASK